MQRYEQFEQKIEGLLRLTAFLSQISQLGEKAKDERRDVVRSSVGGGIKNFEKSLELVTHQMNGHFLTCLTAPIVDYEVISFKGDIVLDIR